MPLKPAHLVGLLMSLKVVPLRHVLFRSMREGGCKRLTRYAERMFSATTDLSKKKYSNVQLQSGLFPYCVLNVNKHLDLLEEVQRRPLR